MPILAAHSMEIISRSPEQTRRVGMRLGGMLQPGDLVCLTGDLGSGKTTLVQGISAGWGSIDQVSSPTFVLVNVYRRPDGQQLYHLDAYRLSSPKEAADLDVDAMLENAPLLVEWSERVQEALPQGLLRVRLTYVDDNQRDLLLDAVGEHHQRMLMTLRKAIYGG